MTSGARAKALASESPPKAGESPRKSEEKEVVAVTATPKKDLPAPAPLPPPTVEPKLDELGYDQNDGLHFFHAWAYKIDQYFSPSPTVYASPTKAAERAVSIEEAEPPPISPPPPTKGATASVPTSGGKKKAAAAKKR